MAVEKYIETNRHTYAAWRRRDGGWDIHPPSLVSETWRHQIVSGDTLEDALAALQAATGETVISIRSRWQLVRPPNSAARRVLKAVAYTYVAAALAALIDVAPWVRVLKF